MSTTDITIVGNYLVSSKLRAEFEHLYGEGDCQRFTELLIRDRKPLKAVENMVKVARYSGHKDLYRKLPKDDPGCWRIVAYSRMFNSKTQRPKIYAVTGAMCSGTAPQQAEGDFMNGYSKWVKTDKNGDPYSKHRAEAAHIIDNAPTQKEWDRMTRGAYHVLHDHSKGMSRSRYSRALAEEAEADLAHRFEAISIGNSAHSKPSLAYTPQDYYSPSPERSLSSSQTPLLLPSARDGYNSNEVSSSSAKSSRKKSDKGTCGRHRKS